MNGAREVRSVDTRTMRRILRHLGGGWTRVSPADQPGRILLDSGERGTISVGRDDLETALRRALVEIGADGRVKATVEGRSLSRRMASGDHSDQHREIAETSPTGPDGLETVLVNRTESPITQLAGRKGRDGRPLLAHGEFAAGERLRADYDRARIMPGIGIDWRSPLARGRRAGAGAGPAEITDAAIAARRRVEAALEAVGPELSGVLVDVCCFLKGLERVEMERGWPARSAKIVLKSALAALARHYDPTRRRGRLVQWGAPGYRPRIAAPNAS